MNDRAYDPNAWFDAFRSAAAPVMRVQEEGLKAVERLVRLQYSVAGDCLESGLAQAHATLEARSIPDYISKETELGARFGDKLRARAQEFMNVASDAQATVSRAMSDAAVKTAETSKKAVA